MITDDGEELFVAERNSMHALNGDRVEVAIAARVKGREPEAEVTEIIEKKESRAAITSGVIPASIFSAAFSTDSGYRYGSPNSARMA